MAKIHIQWLKKKAEATAKHLCAMQKIEIVPNTLGDCITTVAPTNDELLDRAANSTHPPEFITRYIFFNFGVPPTCEWTNPNPIQRDKPTIGIQQFTYSGWLKQIEAEKVAGDGHISPYLLDLILEAAEPTG